MIDKLQVGVITSPHGVNGEVKVYPTTDDVMRFKKLKTVILDDGKTERELTVVSTKFQKNLVIVKFKEFQNRNEVEKLREAKLLVTRDQAVKLAPGEYFIADLIGLQVISDEGEELGVLEEVLETGANNVYVIRKPGASDLLVPAIDECSKTIDFEAGIMKLHLIPGRRDL